MALLPLVLWALSGCSSVESLITDLTGGEAARPATPPPPKAEAAAPELGGAVGKALRDGKYVDALAAAEKALAEHPELDASWDLVELVGVQGRVEGALLDRLAVDAAIGGRADRHHGLRARLALAARRPADVAKAATMLEDSSPTDAAAYMAWAVQAGAPEPAEMTPLAHGLLTALRDPVAPLPAEAATVTGGAAAVLIGELRAARGDLPGAAASFDLVATGPLALQIRAYRGRASVNTDSAKALDAGTALAAALATAGDFQDAGGVLSSAITPAAGAGKLDALLAIATGLRKSAVDLKAGEAIAFAAAAESEIALRAGQPKLANEGAVIASETAGTKARGQWALAMSAAMLGDADGVQAAATGLPGDEVRAVRALLGAMNGEAVFLPSPGLSGDKAALEALLGAPYLADPVAAYAGAAREAVGADLKLWAALAASRAPGVATADSAGQLRAEDQVRGWLAHGPGGPLVDSSHPASAAWTTALSGSPVPAGAGVASVGRFRQSLASRDGSAASTALVESAAIIPPWRSGPLAPILALEGPVAGDILQEADFVGQLADPIPTAVALHGWSHRSESARRLWTHGASALPAQLPVERRLALFDAAARLRAGELGWARGVAPWPAEAEKALAELAKAPDLAVPPLLTASGLRDRISRSAVLSVIRTPSGNQLLVVTDEKGKLVQISESIVADISTFREALSRSVNNVAEGDRIRGELLDPVMDVLTGIGGYTLVGPGPVADAPIPQLPEQADGLRFLASIRHVTRVADFESLVPPARVTQEYALSAFALCSSSEEAELVRRHWPDATVEVGADATVASWKANAGKARYLVVGAFAAAPGGGFLLPGGETLTLGTVSNTLVYATNIAILGAADSDASLARASAFRGAGGGEVLATVWEPGATFREVLLSAFFEGINKRKGSSRAFDEARTQAIKLAPEGSADPGHWGGYLLFSAL